ncbi:IS110 family transposase [Streptomyces sp. NBC_00006]|uniref:IS110 family transposase n=1 Tax=Streptomyces sp. NBC_00006 TaxID=2975619 RepID=UPI00224D5F5C|nr:IS110 family transposase [Streptomyces sp. NBC_00006]MCX5532712.1 IS110 family transposase [Streptomyces sp. NBC_00006]MCX5535229.1 IS110 family transposase [Streptomyces sp. NBC_00006]
MNTIVAHTHSFVIGVDTHARTHTYAVLAANGEQLGTEAFPNTHAGRARAINWAGRRTGGDLGALWVIEGAGSYGAQIARQTARAGYQVVEAARMGRASRHGIGKSDSIDARRIAAAVLPLPEHQLRTPRLDEGVRAAAQILLTSRDELTSERTRAVNALTALVRIADLGMDARRSLSTRQIGEIARWRPREEDLAVTTARTEAVRLAKRIVALDAEIADNMSRLGELVDASPAASLPDETGIGPVTAATVLVAWSHPGRVRDEAAFAALAGVSPIPASSGNTTRHRLNRGGDRRLNRALNVIAMVRMVHHPQTRAYVDRRRAEGKTDREIRRCLKRYLARRLYRHLNATAAKLGVDET